MILRKKGFTLIELLVVMAIIGMLASALVLSLSKAGKIATDMKCKAN
jgi:prepilin-type N-terminal cleavage/methylation domain-containing protein